MAVTGLDIDEDALAQYTARVARLQAAGEIGTDVVLTTSTQAFPWREGEAVPTADMVAMAHVLHFFPDRVAAIRGAIAALRPGGCFVLVQQQAAGVPQVQREVREGLAGDQGVYFTADEVQGILDGELAGTYASYHRHVVPGYMDLGALVAPMGEAAVRVCVGVRCVCVQCVCVQCV